MTHHQFFFAVLILLTLATSGFGDEPKLMTSNVRKDGTLLVNGKPVLPYGFYISTGHTGDMRLKCVELVHKIGGTVVHIEGPWHEDTRFLDRAAELGLWVVAGHTETEAKLDRVKKFKDHPAIIAWTLYDDANTLSTVEHLTKMNKLIKEIVPHRLTYIPLGTQSREVLMPADGFFNCSDVIGWEMYPVANSKAKNDKALKETETQMSLVAKAASRANRPYWILTQTFAWPGGRLPSRTEYRNLCYVGLINGAKGVMPWSIYYKGDSPEVKAKKKAEGKPSWEEWYLPDSKDLWAECGSVGMELQSLAPMLLDGKRTKLTQTGDVTAAIWDGDKEALVVVANLSETEARPVSLELQKQFGSQLTPAFNDRPAGLKLVNGRITGEIAKAEVHVYRIAKP
jgi:hypothetical protein